MFRILRLNSYVRCLIRRDAHTGTSQVPTISLKGTEQTLDTPSTIFMTLEIDVSHSMDSGPVLSVNTQRLVLPMDGITLLCSNKNQKATSVSWNSAGFAQWLLPTSFMILTTLMKTYMHTW